MIILEDTLHPCKGERGGSVVECRTPEREVRGSRPTAAVLCPWARHFTPRKYWLITQEAMAPSRYDWKIVDWDVKPQHNNNKKSIPVTSNFLHQNPAGNMLPGLQVLKLSLIHCRFKERHTRKTCKNCSYDAVEPLIVICFLIFFSLMSLQFNIKLQNIWTPEKLL